MKKIIKVQVLTIVMTLSLTSCGAAIEIKDIESSQSSIEYQKQESSLILETEIETNIEDTTIIEVEEATTEVEELNESQKNSIAMLNYLATLSQEINDSKNSRLFLEEAYASLINNTNPEKVNELTESHLSSLLDIIEKYRFINVKRERLQYIYDNNKAMAIKEAMPNPIALLSAANSSDMKQFAMSVIYMAVDSYNSYTAYNNQLDQEFLQDGWTLDDEEANNVHDSRKRAFMFMIEIVREEELPGELALNEKAVEEFVKWKNNDNTYQRLQFWESEEETYYAFGNYWLELAKCYYEQENYAKCLESVEKYEKLQADIFRKDYYFAQMIPTIIVAASEIYDVTEYVPIVEKYLEILLDNTENDEWSLRYFASQMYIDLYAKTNKEIYLDKAYEIVLNNVNFLIEEQNKINIAYLNDVQEVTVPKTATKDEEKQIKNYNKELKKQREIELPEMYEPLVLNCELLFALAQKINITEMEQEKIEGILYGKEKSGFLTIPIKNKYSFTETIIDIDAEYNKNEFTIPVYCVSENSVIQVIVEDSGEVSTYTDWSVKKVERPTEEFSSFVVTYVSKEIEKQAWSVNSKVTIKIYDEEDSIMEPIIITFEVSNYKDMVLFDVVEFEEVK